MQMLYGKMLYWTGLHSIYNTTPTEDQVYMLWWRSGCHGTIDLGSSNLFFMRKPTCSTDMQPSWIYSTYKFCRVCMVSGIKGID